MSFGFWFWLGSICVESVRIESIWASFVYFCGFACVKTLLWIISPSLALVWRSAWVDSSLRDFATLLKIAKSWQSKTLSYWDCRQTSEISLFCAFWILRACAEVWQVDRLPRSLRLLAMALEKLSAELLSLSLSRC